MRQIIFDKIESGFRVELSVDITNYISNEEMPLSFRVEDWLTSDIFYQCELGPGWWATYDNNGFKNFSVYTKSGKLLKRHTFNPYTDTNEIEELFNLWIVGRQRTKGLVLGAGNGRWGEWLLPVLNNDCSAVLVEADPDNIGTLNAAHSWRANVKVDHCAVSDEGGTITFWKAPQNMVSSLDKSIVEKFWPDSEPEAVSVESKTINQLVTEHFDGDLDWIRMDIEGLDHRILMSLDLELTPKLSMVLFENMNITEEEQNQMTVKLQESGFNKIIKVGIDTMCIKE